MTFARRIAIGAALAGAVPLVFSLIIFLNHRINVQQTREVIEREQRALALTNYLQRLVIDMDAGIRGFRVTGEEPYLEPYVLAVSRYPSVVYELRGLLAPRPELRRLLADIEAGIERWRRDWAEPRIAYLRRFPPTMREDRIVLPPVPRELQIDMGKRATDDLRRRFEDLADREREQIAAALTYRDRAEKHVSSIFWFAAVGSSLFFLLGSWHLSRVYRRRVGALFAGIEAVERGGFAPVPLQGRDEPARIAAAFNRMVRDVGRRDEDLRRQAEQLQEARGQLASVLDSVAEGVVVADRNGKFVLFNPAAERILGLGATATDPADWPRIYGAFRPDAVTPFPADELPLVRAVRGESPDDVEMFIRNPQVPAGVWISVSGRPIRDADDAIRGGVVVFRDITERKRAEEEIGRFFSVSLDLLCIADFDGYFKRLNPAWEKTLGLATAELLSRPLIEFVHPEDRAATLAEAAKLGAQEHDTVAFTNRYRCADGTYKWLVWNARSDHRYRLIYAAARDVTEEKRTQEQIRKLNEELQHRLAELDLLNKELEAFSYSVSHDLRAPLRHIAGFAELLGKGAAASLDEKNRRYLWTVVDSAKRMGRLIDDLLAFSRMGRAPMRMEPVKLAELVAGARAELEPDAAGREVVWKVDGLPVVRGDPALLRQAVVNLLSNALKYTSTRPRAEIEIGSHRQGEETVVFVRDNGVGFDMRYADKLFGVFQRLHRAEEFDGTGIGLANVRRIIHRHGGRTWAEGEAGRGATFYFSLPAAEEVET